MQIRFDADDLIYNRFDVIHNNQYKALHIDTMNGSYEIMIYIENNLAKLNIWGKLIPDYAMDKVIKAVFEDKKIYGVKIERTVQNYCDFLYKSNDFKVPLPGTVEELLNRVERRDRATIRRKKRWLDERVGSLRLEKFHNDIPLDIVKIYFDWKRTSHGADYKLAPEEYIEKYYVTDALRLRAGENNIAIAFYCGCNQTAFFENFSYNADYREYSPGLLMYEMLLEHLIDKKYKALYMAGGNYIYKRRFGSEETECYSGVIYRSEFMDCLKKVMEQYGIPDEIAIYGYGKYGNIFVPILRKLGKNIRYAIDRKAESDEQVLVKTPDEDLADISDVIITMENKDISVQQFLAERGKRAFYITDLIKEAKGKYIMVD